MSKILSIKEQYKVYRSADAKVLNFIDRFRSQSKDLSRIFTQGYCYYFAAMLKDAFGGDIYLSPETDHIIWSDDKNIFYDINGVCNDRIKKSDVMILPKEKLKAFRKI